MLMKSNPSTPENGGNNGKSGASVTQSLLKARGSVYGKPVANLSCSYNLNSAYEHGVRNRNKYLFATNSDRMAHDEAIRMALFKIARIATAGAHHADNYDDLIGYVTIAKQIAMEKIDEDATRET